MLEHHALRSQGEPLNPGPVNTRRLSKEHPNAGRRGLESRACENETLELGRIHSPQFRGTEHLRVSLGKKMTANA